MLIYIINLIFNPYLVVYVTEVFHTTSVSIFCSSSKTVHIILLLNVAYDVRREFTIYETYPVNLKLFSSVRSYDVFFPCK